MADKSIYLVIKALNERIADVGRTFGTDSKLYESYENKINRLLPASIRGESRKGFVKIKNSKQAQQLLTGDLAKQFEKITQTKTRGEYVRQKRKQLKAEGEEKSSYEDIISAIQTETVAKRAIEEGKTYDNYESYMSKEDLRTLRKSKKSWTEINKVFRNIFENEDARKLVNVKS